jgi:ketosteroid isomerase-like protein
LQVTVTSLQQQNDKLNENTATTARDLKDALARSEKAEEALAALRKKFDDVSAQQSARPDSDRAAIEQLLADYRAAYEEVDAARVMRLLPSGSPNVEQAFSQVRSQAMEIINPRTSIEGDTAVVTFVRRLTTELKVGTRPSPRLESVTMRLRRSADGWAIAASIEITPVSGR